MIYSAMYVHVCGKEDRDLCTYTSDMYVHLCSKQKLKLNKNYKRKSFYNGVMKNLRLTNTDLISDQTSK